MNKYILSKLRDTEQIILCEQVVVWVNKQSRNCQFVLVSSKQSEFELA